jgi:hypothetical protein
LNCSARPENEHDTHVPPDVPSDPICSVKRVFNKSSHPIFIDKNGTFRIEFELEWDDDGESSILVISRFTSSCGFSFPHEECIETCKYMERSPSGWEVYQNLPKPHIFYFEQPTLSNNRWVYELFDMFPRSHKGLAVEYTLEISLQVLYTPEKAQNVTDKYTSEMTRITTIFDHLSNKPDGPGYLEAQSDFEKLSKRIT